MKRLALVAAVVLLAATPAPVWLDAKQPANWNVLGAPIPEAPGPKDAELAAGGRCASEVRPPTTPEDREVVAKGWYLVGPYERYGDTSVFMATSSADGMCRPDQYQGFAFVDDVFAGTLSPHPMVARGDASIGGLSVEIYNAREFSATFARYSDSDALCCPHASTNVTYKIESKDGKHLVYPFGTETNKNT